MQRRLTVRTALASVLLASAALGQQPDQRAYLDLFVNEVQKDSVLVRLRGGEPLEDALVSVPDLEKAGLHGLGGTREQHDGREYVSLRSLDPLVKFRMDPEALSLRLTAQPQLLEATQLDLRPMRRPAEMVLHRDTSAFFNYSVTGAGSGAFSGAAELGASLGGNLAYSGANVLPDGTVVRGLTNLTLDRPEELRRVVVGDSYTSSTSLGGAAIVGGISVSREFGLDPYFVRQPLPRMSGAILSPSTLDVYVNGALVRSEPVAPGPFEVRNLPVLGGAGQISYVVRDSFGRTQEYSAPYYASAGLLAPGLSEYGYQFGLTRLDFGRDSLRYGPPSLSARHRLGLTEDLTAGYRFEAALQHVSGWDALDCRTCASVLTSGGPSATLRLPFGQVDLEAAASTDGQEPGAAASAGYSLMTRRFSAAVVARAFTARYATLSLPAWADRPVLDLRGAIGAPVTRLLGLSLEGGFSSRRDSGLTSSVALRADLRVSRSTAILLSVTRERLPGLTPQFSAFASLLYSFGNSSSVELGGNATAQTAGAAANLQKGLPPGEGFGYQIRSAIDRQAGGSGLGQVVYQGRYGTYTGVYTRTGASDAGSMSAAGAVVLVDGTLMASRPVQDGYAVLQVPGLEGVRGYLNNQEIGRTDRRGLLMIPRLQSYYGNRLSIGDADIPIDYEIGQLAQVVATPLRGGAMVRFDVQRVRGVSGLVRVEEEVPAYGELLIDDKVRSPIGTHGEFWFADLAVGRHDARVEYAEGICRFVLEVPRGTSGAVNLGEVRCPRREKVATAP